MPTVGTQLNIMIDPDKRDRLKRACHGQGITLNELVNRLIDDWLINEDITPKDNLEELISEQIEAKLSKINLAEGNPYKSEFERLESRLNDFEERFSQLEDKPPRIFKMIQDNLSEIEKLKEAISELREKFKDNQPVTAPPVNTDKTATTGEDALTPSTEKQQSDLEQPLLDGDLEDQQNDIRAKFKKGLNQAELSRRLGMNSSSVSRNKNKSNFPQWSRKLDPDRVSWESRGDKFYPCYE